MEGGCIIKTSHLNIINTVKIIHCCCHCLFTFLTSHLEGPYRPMLSSQFHVIPVSLFQVWECVSRSWQMPSFTDHHATANWNRDFSRTHRTFAVGRRENMSFWRAQWPLISSEWTPFSTKAP